MATNSSKQSSVDVALTPWTALLGIRDPESAAQGTWKQVRDLILLQVKIVFKIKESSKITSGYNLKLIFLWESD